MEDQLVNNTSVYTLCPVKLTTIELTRNRVGPKLLPQWMYQVANLPNQASYQVVRHVCLLQVSFDCVRFRVLRVETLVFGGQNLLLRGMLCVVCIL